MAPSVLITVALVILMAKRLVDMYAGGHYICPSMWGEKAPTSLGRLSLEPATVAVSRYKPIGFGCSRPSRATARSQTRQHRGDASSVEPEKA